MHRADTTSMNTDIQTIGGAILIQAAIRYAAYVVLAWLALSFVDGWVMAYLSAAN